MSDLVRNPNCWFSHAQAHISCNKKVMISCFTISRTAGLHLFHMYETGFLMVSLNENVSWTARQIRLVSPQIKIMQSKASLEWRLVRDLFATFWRQKLNDINTTVMLPSH